MNWWANHGRPGGSTLFLPGSWVVGLVLITASLILIGIYLYREDEARKREQRPRHPPRTYQFDDHGRIKKPTENE